MTFEVAKRNRLNGKFNFKPKDWQVELDGLEEHPRVPFRNGRPRKSKLIWKREGQPKNHLLHDEADVG